MTWYSDTIALIRALVWPAVALFALWRFHRPLTALLDRVWKVQGFGVSIELTEAAAQAAEVRTVMGEVAELDLTAARALLTSDPAQAVIQAWNDLHVAAMGLWAARGGGLHPKGGLAVGEWVIKRLAEQEKIDQRLQVGVSALFDSFMKAAQDRGSVTAQDAVIYVQLAQQVGDALLAAAAE